VLQLTGDALLFGLAAAFFYPAQPALIPRLVEEEQLLAGALVKLNPKVFLLVTGGLAAVLSLLAALNFLVREKDMSEPATQ
jgi:hypothetical protein